MFGRFVAADRPALPDITRVARSQRHHEYAARYFAHHEPVRRRRRGIEERIRTPDVADVLHAQIRVFEQVGHLCVELERIKFVKRVEIESLIHCPSVLQPITHRERPLLGDTASVPVQLKAELVGPEPIVWRRIVVADETTLAHLHIVIQAAFGWEDRHQHEFIVGSSTYAIPGQDDEDWNDDAEDSRDVYLRSIAETGDRFAYVYDFGDDWRLDLVVEDSPTELPDLKLPTCVDGDGANPPEDCGGVHAYQSLVDANTFGATAFVPPDIADELDKRT